MTVRALVAAPPAVPSPVGLLASARLRGGGDDAEWVRGLAYAPEGCGRARGYYPCATRTPFTASANAPQVNHDPIAFYVDETCSAMGMHDDATYRARVARHLEAAIPLALEREFWRGTIATANSLPNNFLAKASTLTDVTPATAPTPQQGLAILEQVLGEAARGGRAMIHVPRGLLPTLGPRREGNLLLSQVDTFVVAGAGYDGSGPDGSIPATGGWLYGTDLVDVWLDAPQVVPDTVAAALDRSVNTISYVAERLAAATFDNCRHFGIRVESGYPIHGTFAGF